MSIVKTRFGCLPDGREASLYTLENHRGLQAVLTDFGAALVSLYVPDRANEMVDVALGYDCLSQYEQNFDMLGVTVGRNVNRIAGGAFSLDGKAYQLEINENANNIHSSMSHGFHKVLWQAAQYSDDSVTFTYQSPDGENGFPGNLDVSLTYTLTDGGAVILSYSMQSDQDTIVNLTNHSYFNLAGEGNILDTLVWINAEHFAPVRKDHIPSGEIRSVAGTPFDFHIEKPIAQDIYADDEQLQAVCGYDHSFLLPGLEPGLRKAATARSPKSGIQMTVYTDLPALQFYTGNTTRDVTGKGGVTITRHSGFCMEPNYVPNSINMPQFQQPVSLGGAVYRTTTIYEFSREVL